jgi:hypothetical protein
MRLAHDNPQTVERFQPRPSGRRAGLRDLGSAWHLPGRALLLGIPPVFLDTALLAWLS